MEGTPFPINTKPLLELHSKRGLGPSLSKCPSAPNPQLSPDPRLDPRPHHYPHRLSLPCFNATRRTSQYGATVLPITAVAFFHRQYSLSFSFFHTSLADDALVSVLHIMDRSRPSPQHPRLCVKDIPLSRPNALDLHRRWTVSRGSWPGWRGCVYVLFHQ